MNTIHTRLTEKQFLERLACLCRKKARFDSGYNDRDIFVYKLNEKKFWLGKHYANVGRHRGEDLLWIGLIVHIVWTKTAMSSCHTNSEGTRFCIFPV